MNYAIHLCGKIIWLHYSFSHFHCTIVSAMTTSPLLSTSVQCLIHGFISPSLLLSSSANSFHSHASYVKHQQLKQAAEREAEMYTHYQTAERQRLGEELRRQGPQPVGGPMLSPEELDERRRLKEQDVNNKERLASIQRKKKREEYQQEQRRREQEEIDKKKQIQREKGERLEAKRVVSKEKELEELRMKRLAYFDNDSST
ncbi:hypothetical protein EMCRGX_G025927 [Ephydatia muelleri]